MTQPASLAVVASGRGRNLEAIQAAINRGDLNARIVGVFSNKTYAPALTFAREHGIPTDALRPRQYADRASYDAALAEHVAAVAPDWVVLAGYMRILTANFIDRFGGQLVNIHPSLLPAYKGLHTHARALAAGERIHGASVHFVTSELDAGPVIRQGHIHVQPDDSAETLADRVMARVERQLYATALAELINGTVVYRNNAVYRDGKPQQEPPNVCYDTISTCHPDS